MLSSQTGDEYGGDMLSEEGEKFRVRIVEASWRVGGQENSDSGVVMDDRDDESGRNVKVVVGKVKNVVGPQRLLF